MYVQKGKKIDDIDDQPKVRDTTNNFIPYIIIIIMTYVELI